jgi:hypothetical protein
MKKAIILAGMVFLAAAAQAKVLHVPGDFATIASAIRSASDGDTILLAPGDYPQSDILKIDKAVTVASRFLESNDDGDIRKTTLSATSRRLAEWVLLSAKGATVVGITFLGTDEHTLNITAPSASVLDCRFLGGKDQVSFTGGGGHVARCHFENAGDDAIDCDKSVSWTIEHNTIVNAHQDGVEVRLHDKREPLTTHIFRHNRVIGSGQSGIQLIDYQGNSFREFHIHNNVFVDCKGSGVSCMYQEKDNTNEVYRGSLMEETAFIFNNTFDGCNYGITMAPHLIILNNIFANLKTRAIGRGSYVTDAVDRSIVDYCLFYNNPLHFDPGVRTGSHLLVDVDPKLHELHGLQEGSPCIDAGRANYLWDGRALTIPASDYRGAAPDLGAVEFSPGTDHAKSAIHRALQTIRGRI